MCYFDDDSVDDYDGDDDDVGLHHLLFHAIYLLVYIYVYATQTERT